MTQPSISVETEENDYTVYINVGGGRILLGKGTVLESPGTYANMMEAIGLYNAKLEAYAKLRQVINDKFYTEEK